MDLISTILVFCAGGVAAMLFDTVWWKINFKKVERGFEVLEHYHFGIILMIGAVLVNLIYEPIAWFLVGMGFVFIIGEWHQSVEIHKKKVVPGKPFAYGSSHFKGSTAIGAGLTGFLIILSLLL